MELKIILDIEHPQYDPLLEDVVRYQGVCITKELYPFTLIVTALTTQVLVWTETIPVEAEALSTQVINFWKTLNGKKG